MASKARKDATNKKPKPKRPKAHDLRLLEQARRETAEGAPAPSQRPVLPRSEAEHLALELGEVIGSVILLTADADEPTRAQALDALSKLQIARNTLELAVREVQP